MTIRHRIAICWGGASAATGADGRDAEDWMVEAEDGPAALLQRRSAPGYSTVVIRWTHLSILTSSIFFGREACAAPFDDAFVPDSGDFSPEGDSFTPGSALASASAAGGATSSLCLFDD